MSNINKNSIIPPAPPSSSLMYELYLGDCIGDYVISYDFNPGGNPSDAIPCRITITDFSDPPVTTGWCGSQNYNQALIDLGQDPIAQPLGSGIITYSKTLEQVNPIDRLYLYIDSPLPGSKWTFSLSCPTVCDSDSDSDNDNIDDLIGCSQVVKLYGPTVIGCGEDYYGGGVRTFLNCSSVIRVYGPDLDSDYCLNCLSNEITLNTQCGDGDSDSDSNNDNDSDSGSDITVNILFDKSSWSSIGSGNYNTPYKSYLDQAADRWAQFVKINPAIVDHIKNTPNSTEPVWDGIKIASQNTVVAAYGPGRFPITIDNNSSDNYIASCGPIQVMEPNRFSGDLSIVPLTFIIQINDHYSNPSNPSKLTSQEWVNVFTHELGHALGIGVFWNPANRGDPDANPPIPADPYPVWEALSNPVDSFLNGYLDKDGNQRSFNVLQNAQKAYNEIVGDLSLTKIPLETSANALSKDGHWNDQPSTNNGNNYPGLFDEIMVSTNVPNMAISRLSIKTLVDFRSYQEINLDAQEATPDTTIVPSMSVASEGCNCQINKLKIIKIIH
jgi:hypothetical protein